MILILIWILILINQINCSELEQLQNEKRKALLEHETAKLRECDEALQRELREWKSQLHPRKQVFSYNFMLNGSSYHNSRVDEYSLHTQLLY